MRDETIFPDDVRARHAPAQLREQAKAAGGWLLRFEDKDGNVHWAVRPYRQGRGADVLAAGNVHYIGICLCEQVALDYIALHTEVYGRDDRENQYLRTVDWQLYEMETEVPDFSAEALKWLLRDLATLNYGSLVGRLLQEFERDFDLSDWWRPEPANNE